MSDVRDTELFSAYLDGEVTSAEQARVEQLLAADPAARQLMDGLRALRGQLQSLPTEKLDEDLSQHVLRAAERRMLLGDTMGATAGLSSSAEPAQRAGATAGLSSSAEQARAGKSPAEPSLWRQISWRGMLSRRALTWSGVAVAVAAWLALTDPNPPARDDDHAVALQDDKRPEKPAAEAAKKRLDDHAPVGGEAVEENGRRPIPAMHAPGWRDESMKETAADQPVKADEKTLDKKAEGEKPGGEGRVFADGDKVELRSGRGHVGGRLHKEIDSSGVAPAAPRPATPAAETARPAEDKPATDNLLKDRVAENKKSSGDEAKGQATGGGPGDLGRQSLKMPRKGPVHEPREADSSQMLDEAMSPGEPPAQRQDSAGRGPGVPLRSFGKAKDVPESLPMKPSAGPAPAPLTTTPAESTTSNLKPEESQADSALLLEQRKQQNAPNVSPGLVQNGTQHFGKRGGNENMELGGGQLSAAVQGSVRSQQADASIHAMIVECETRPEAIERQALEKLLVRGGLTVVQRSTQAPGSYSASSMIGNGATLPQSAGPSTGPSAGPSADIPEGSDDASQRVRGSGTARVVVVEARATPQQVGVILAELGRSRDDFPSFAVRPAAVEDSRRQVDREAMSRSAPASGLKRAETGDVRLKSKGDGKQREQPADQQKATQKAEQEKAPPADPSYRIVFVLRVVESRSINAAAAERAKAADAVREAAPAGAAPPAAKK